VALEDLVNLGASQTVRSRLPKLLEDLVSYWITKRITEDISG